MSNGNHTAWPNPEIIGIRLPELEARRNMTLDLATANVDNVTENDLDIHIATTHAEVPSSVYGEAVLTAMPDAPIIDTAATLAPVQDGPELRQAAIEADAQIDLKQKVEDTLRHDFWTENVLSETPMVPVAPAQPVQPVAAFNPLATWGGQVAPQTNAAPIENPRPVTQAPVLEFPRQTHGQEPAFTTHTLPTEFVADRVGNPHEPVVVKPAPNFWNTTNSTESGQQTPVVSLTEAQERLQAARARVEQLHNLQAA